MDIAAVQCDDHGCEFEVRIVIFQVVHGVDHGADGGGTIFRQFPLLVAGHIACVQFREVLGYNPVSIPLVELLHILLIAVRRDVRNKLVIFPVIGKACAGCHGASDAECLHHGAQAIAHDHDAFQAELILGRIDKVVELVKGGGNVHAQLVAPVLADEITLIDDLLVKNGVPGHKLAVVIGNRFLQCRVILQQIPVLRHVVRHDLVINDNNDLILQRLGKGTGIVLVNGGKHIRIIAGRHDQVELGIARHGTEGIPLRCYTDGLRAQSNGVKVPVRAHVHLPGHGSQCRFGVKDRKAHVSVRDGIGQGFPVVGSVFQFLRHFFQRRFCLFGNIIFLCQVLCFCVLLLNSLFCRYAGRFRCFGSLSRCCAAAACKNRQQHCQGQNQTDIFLHAKSSFSENLYLHCMDMPQCAQGRKSDILCEFLTVQYLNL